MDESAVILVVDDDPRMLDAVSDLLTNAGYQVKCTSKGRDCLRLAQDHKPALVLLDAELPDLSGVEVCQSLKAEPALNNTCVVLVSGLRTTSENQAEGLEAGADGYIVRPVSNRELLARVQSLLRVKQAEDTLRERTDALSERVKELNCLYGISALVEQPEVSLPEILRGMVELLPPAWQYSEIAEARIELDGREYQTQGFQVTAWRQARDIYVDGMLVGAVQVCYLEERSECDEGPFLNEERNLLNAIAERVGRIVERLRAQEALRESETRYRALFESAPMGIGLATPEGKILAANDAMIHMTGYSEAELMQINVRSLYKHPHEREQVVERLRERGFVRGLEVQLEHKNGTAYDASLNISPFTVASEDVLLTVVEDVTERKTVAEQLEGQLELLQTLLDTIPSPVFYKDTAGRYTGCNRAFEDFIGTSIDEIIGKTVYDISPKEIADKYHEKDLELLRHPGKQRYEWLVKRYDGEQRNVIFHKATIRDADGNVEGLIGVISDITKRRRMEDALRESESRLRTVIESLPFELFVLGADARYSMQNSACRRRWGNIVGRRPEDAPVDGETVAWWQSINRRAFTGEVVEGEVIHCPQGKEEYYFNIVSPIRDGDQVRGVLGVNIDITDRKRAEQALERSQERYQLAQRAANIGSWDWNVRTGALHWSDRIEPMFGFRRGAFAGTYAAFLECIHPQDRQRVIDAVETSVAKGDDYAIEHRIVWPDGTERWVSETGDVIRDGGGAAIRMLGVVQDITERKQAELALQVAKDTAEAARRDEEERRQEAEQRRRIAESLGDVLAVLNSNQSLDEVLDYIAVQAGRLLDNQAVAIYNLEGQAETLTIQAAQGLPIGYVAGADIPIGHGALRQALTLRKPVTVPDVVDSLSDDANLEQDAYRRALVEYWADIYRAMLAVPIVVKDELYGGILLYYANPRVFTDDEVELALAFANQVALAIENARLRDQVQLAAATAERSRLARELHDAVTQTLFSASLIAEAMPRVWDRDPAEGRRGLEELRQLTRGASAEMRTMLLELRPAALTEKPMDELLRHLTEAVTGRTRVPVTLTTEGARFLPPQVQIALYRIAQEALNNVAKHSGARQAAVDLHGEAGRVSLSIRDDGCGFDPSDIRPDQLGLGIMRERAESIGAELQVRSHPGHGTEVVADWRGTHGRRSHV